MGYFVNCCLTKSNKYKIEKLLRVTATDEKDSKVRSESFIPGYVICILISHLHNEKLHLDTKCTVNAYSAHFDVNVIVLSWLPPDAAPLTLQKVIQVQMQSVHNVYSCVKSRPHGVETS